MLRHNAAGKNPNRLYARADAVQPISAGSLPSSAFAALAAGDGTAAGAPYHIVGSLDPRGVSTRLLGTCLVAPLEEGVSTGEGILPMLLKNWACV